MNSPPTKKNLEIEVIDLCSSENSTAAGSPGISPASSPVSIVSSLPSISPPLKPINVRPVPDSAGGKTTGTKASNSTAIEGGAYDEDQEPKGATSSEIAAASGHTSILTHFNFSEFPKINACVLGSKGAAASEALPTGIGEAYKPMDALTMNDLDVLQAELETLWSKVASRIRILHREQSCLQSNSGTSHHGHNLGLEHFDPQHQGKIASVASSFDRGTGTEVSAAAVLEKRAQLVTGNSPVPNPSTVASTASTPIAKRATAKGERSSKKKLKGEEAEGGKPKNAGEQFWDTMKSYCRDLSKDDIDGLHGILEDRRELPNNLFEVPPLGKHFRNEEDTAKLRARESSINSSRDCVSPLTQRLVSALVDERVSMYDNNNLNSPKEDASLGTSANNNPEGGYVIHRHLFQALSLDSGGNTGNTPTLESRIRDSLMDDGNDPTLMTTDDEILAEIKRTQSTLKKLRSYNTEKVNEVIQNGKKAMDRDIHKRDLEKANKDVFEAFQKISMSRLKKKSITKEEKESATKVLEERKRALLKLEAIRPHHDNDI